MLCIATAIWIFLDKRSSLYLYDNVRTPQISKSEGETYVYRKLDENGGRDLHTE